MPYDPKAAARARGTEEDRRRAAEAQAPPEYAARAALSRLDEVAREMERKWGIGRLPGIVGDLFGIKFEAQRDKLNRAIEADEPGQVIIHAEAMARAWRALDKEAAANGAKPLDRTVWEMKMPTGEVVRVCRTAEEAHAVQEPDKPAFALEEIAKLLGEFKGFWLVHEIKAKLGNTVANVEGKGKGVTEDELPF